MPTEQVPLWAENTGIGVSQWEAETIGIWQVVGGKKDNGMIIDGESGSVGLTSP